jgi:pseudouridine synthase
VRVKAPQTSQHPPADAPEPRSGSVRLQKFLADAGVASRRASEEIIVGGRVSVNGKVVDQMGAKVDPLHDRVTVDGKQVKARRKLYVALNKPAGYVSSRSDEVNRRTVLDLLPREWNNLYPVGRLDYETEGLLFLTNDGDFCLKLTHPRYGVTKTYRAVVEGEVQTELLQQFTRGVFEGGEKLCADRARLLASRNGTSVIELELSEGKNRQVRRMFESVGVPVVHLERTKIGPIKLGELRRGKWRTLTEPEIKSLLRKL